MAALDFVKLHELAGLRIGLREKAVGHVGVRHRDGGVEHAARRMKGGAFQVLARFRDRNLGEDLMVRGGGNQTEEGRVVVRVGDDDDLLSGRRPCHWRAPCRPSKFSRWRPGFGIDDLDCAVAVADPELGAAIDDHNAVRTRGIAALGHADEAGDARDVFVGLGVEDDDGLVVLVGEIAKPARLVDGDDAQLVDRRAGYRNRRDLLQVLRMSRRGHGGECKHEKRFCMRRHLFLLAIQLFEFQCRSTKNMQAVPKQCSLAPECGLGLFQDAAEPHRADPRGEPGRVVGLDRERRQRRRAVRRLELARTKCGAGSG